MTNLSDFYKSVNTFCDDHDMVNQFLFIGSEEELDSKEFDYRTFIVIPSKSNISRTLNRPVYTLSFDCIIIDRYILDNSLSMMKTIEENLFISGQFQDYLIQEDEDVDFGEIEIDSLSTDEYNISSVMFTVDIDFARAPYVKDIIS